MPVTTPPHGPIETRELAGNARHFLLGKELHAGAAPTIEMRLADGSWLPGFYDYRVIKDFTHIATFSVTYRYASTSGIGTATVTMDAPTDALYRWPPESILSNLPHP